MTLQVGSPVERFSRRRRWAIGLSLLGACLLTNVGHSIGTPEGFVDNAACRDGSLFARPVGDGQTGPAGAPLSVAMELPLFCRGLATGIERSAFEGVDWTVTSGGGRVNDLPEGVPLVGHPSNRSVEWELGPTVGTQTLTARSGGVTVSFTATALPPGPGGNCSDEPAVTGGVQFGRHRQIFGRLRLTAAGSPYRVGTVGTSNGAELHIDAGVVLCATGEVRIDGPLQARGTAARPITLSAPSLFVYRDWPDAVASTTPTALEHVVGDGVRLLVVQAPATVSDTRWRAPSAAADPTCTYLMLRRQPGALDVRRSVFEGYRRTSDAECPAAVNLLSFDSPAASRGLFSARVQDSVGPGVSVTGDADRWTLDACAVTRSSGDGIVVRTPGVRIVGCNIVDNAGAGVSTVANTASPGADARGNWWGDPAGPLAAGGDGIVGNVDAGGPLPEPVVLGY